MQQSRFHQNWYSVLDAHLYHKLHEPIAHYYYILSPDNDGFHRHEHAPIVLPVKQHRQSIVLVQDIGLKNLHQPSVFEVYHYWNVGLDQGVSQYQ